MKKNKTNKTETNQLPKKTSKFLIPILLTAVALITFSVYYSNLDDHFVDFDDTRAFCENPLVQSPPTFQGVKTVFTHFYADGNYVPLVGLSFMIDYQLY